MAKANKAIMLLEKHLDKIAIGLAAAICLYVVATQFVLDRGVEDPAGQSVSISQYVEDAANDADSIARRLQQTQVPDESETSDDTLLALDRGIFDIPSTPLDQPQPIAPPYTSRLAMEDVEQTIEIQPLPQLASPLIELYRTRLTPTATRAAFAPDMMGGMPPMPGLPGLPETPGAAGTAQTSEDIRDVDFVTVEASIPMAQIRDLFRKTFENPRLQQQPRFTQPIVAAVRLERAQLEASGAWGSWQRVPRLENDPVANSPLPSEHLSEYSSRVEYVVLMENRQQAQTQLAILQPPGYPVPDQQNWLSPSQLAEQERAREEATRTQRRPGGAGAMPFDGGMMGPGAGRPGAFGTGRTMQSGAAQQVLMQEEVPFWAHDATGIPGQVYRYRLRVAFFNPIAGRDWFADEQQDLKDQVLLWSDPIEPQKVVRVPDRIIFFPKTQGTGVNVVGIDVYRWEHGTWYRKTFSVSPGEPIGREDIPELQGTRQPGEEPPTIDFRTNVLLLDIIPNVAVQRRRGANFEALETPVLVIAEANGQTARLPVSNRLWPEDLRGKLTRVRQAYQDQEQRQQRRPGQPGLPGQPPGMIGMPPF